MKHRQLRLPISFRLPDEPYNVIDVETTGLDPEIDRVVEVAALRFESGRLVDRFETLIDPGRDIPPAASEQHHLVAEDLEGSPPIEAIEDELERFVGDDPIFAHNAKFDGAFLPFLSGKTWACSARAARHAWPNAERHRNQFLRYYLKLDAPGLRKATAHRAGGDAHVTGLIVHEALKLYEIAYPGSGMGDFLSHIASPVPIRVLGFGAKHRGKPLTDVPSDYFAWMLKNVADLDDDLRVAIEAEMDRRAEVRRAA
jgi:exodeoxyribonuclease X